MEGELREKERERKVGRERDKKSDKKRRESWERKRGGERKRKSTKKNEERNCNVQFHLSKQTDGAMMCNKCCNLKCTLVNLKPPYLPLSLLGFYFIFVTALNLFEFEGKDIDEGEFV